MYAFLSHNGSQIVAGKSMTSSDPGCDRTARRHKQHWWPGWGPAASQAPAALFVNLLLGGNLTGALFF